GSELRVNQTTVNSQQLAAVAMSASGDFAVTWSSLGEDGDDYGVELRRYDAAGNPLSDELQVNTYTTYAQFFSSVAMDAGGDFVVVWSSYQDGDDKGVYGQRYRNAVHPQTDVSVAGGDLVVTDINTPSDDHLSVTLSGGNLVFHDPNNALKAGPG